jgi:hypothetical protein
MRIISRKRERRESENLLMDDEESPNVQIRGVMKEVVVEVQVVEVLGKEQLLPNMVRRLRRQLLFPSQSRIARK